MWSKDEKRQFQIPERGTVEASAFTITSDPTEQNALIKSGIASTEEMIRAEEREKERERIAAWLEEQGLPWPESGWAKDVQHATATAIRNGEHNTRKGERG